MEETENSQIVAQKKEALPQNERKIYAMQHI